MEYAKGDEIRRYHPSLPEQSILSPNLKKYFSYPERSPDRSRIASEVSFQLSKYSNHWTSRAVRLWFNNNRKTVYDDIRISSENSNPSLNQRDMAGDSPKNYVQSINFSNRNMSSFNKSIEERNTSASTPEDVNDSKGSSLSILKELEDEAAWLSFNDPRMASIIDQYDEICFKNPVLSASSPIKSSNFIEFPPFASSVSPISIVDLLNRKFKTDQIITSAFWVKRQYAKQKIPKLKVGNLVNGMAAFIERKNGDSFLSYSLDPEFSVNWKSIPLFQEMVSGMIIDKSRKSVWVLTKDRLNSVSIDSDDSHKHFVLTSSNGVPTMATSLGALICGFDLSKSVHYINNDFKADLIDIGVDSGVSSLSLFENSIVCGLSKSTSIKMFSIDGKEIRSFLGHRGSVTKLHPVTSNSLISSSSDGSVKLWDIREKRPVATLMADEAIPITLAGSSSYAIAGYSDRKIRVIDIRHKRIKPLIGLDLKLELPSFINYNSSLDTLMMFSDDLFESSDSHQLFNSNLVSYSPFIKGE